MTFNHAVSVGGRDSVNACTASGIRLSADDSVQWTIRMFPKATPELFWYVHESNQLPPRITVEDLTFERGIVWCFNQALAQMNAGNIIT